MKFPNNFYRSFLLALLLCLPLNSPQLIAQTKTGPLQIRQFNQAHLDSLKALSDYDYQTKRYSFSQTWDAFLAWIWYNILRFIFNDKTADFWEVFIYIAAIGGLIFFLRHQFKSQIGSLFYQPARSSVELRVSGDDINQVNLDERLQRAVENKQYRDGVRFLYLLTLKKLSDKGLIRWREDKTNFDFLREMRDQSTYPQFFEITRFYEYTWYGHFDINEHFFSYIRENYNTLNKNTENA